MVELSVKIHTVNMKHKQYLQNEVVKIENKVRYKKELTKQCNRLKHELYNTHDTCIYQNNTFVIIKKTNEQCMQLTFIKT